MAFSRTKQSGKGELRVNSFTLCDAIYSRSIAKKFDLNATTTLVLIGLTTHYNPNKTTVFPSQKYLAEHLNLSERSVIRALKDLVDKKMILKTRNRNHNVYCFTNLFFEVTTGEESTCQNVTDKTAHSDTMSDRGCQNVSCKGDKMSYKHKKENKIKNIGSFNNFSSNGLKDQAKSSVDKTKDLIESYKNVEKSSPLDFSQEEAIEYLKNLPAILKNSFFATKLREKWNLHESGNLKESNTQPYLIF